MRSMSFKKWAAFGLGLAPALSSPPAAASPKLGDLRPSVRLVDAWDRAIDTRSLGDKPVLVVYEDRDSASENQVLKDELSKLARGDRYKRSIALLAIADVSGFDYWPARGFVKDAIQEESRKAGTTIYCDWNGEVRRAFGLRTRRGGLRIIHDSEVPVTGRR